VRTLENFPALKGRAFFLVHPGFGISTPWSYQNLARFPKDQNGRAGRAEKLVAALRANDWNAIRENIYNSLEAPAFDKFPVLQLYKEFLRENGALVSLMSGSGSTTFAIAENLAAADALAEKFKLQFGDKGWMATVAI
jgi:4-diphosphocytidyl-2-C-methyl-D-erythritol kinase